ncbi:phosphodiesterase, family [Thermincola ferriacetica]|uniref:Phosphoesterase n=2 Tax=Thermincola TaxID=278993 RepID=D5XBH3_THEPJ|nr:MULTISPECIES: metallophosphoesterase [Thermincola]ADG83402.1 phosphodiesterase, MJ0936 family [Thermincola potens JR]KNZ69586.1 phosphodiesterase, family [Thermincola ferriacetica]
MRIGVVSDSHGRMDFLRDAVKEMREIDLLLHAGDHYKDALDLAKELTIPVYAVAGNCDWHVNGPDEEVIEVAGRKILLTHGHSYNVKSGNDRLIEKIKKGNYDLIVYGHTHIPEVLPVGSAFIFNPGSIAKPRRGNTRTYGIVELKNYGLQPYIKEISG